jgi:hypothetical protein
MIDRIRQHPCRVSLAACTPAGFIWFAVARFGLLWLPSFWQCFWGVIASDRRLAG